MPNPFLDSEVQTETEFQPKLPNMYKVILHNDDKTTVDFVITLLMHVFHKDQDDAIQIMSDVHHNGRGVAGLYVKEVAQEKTKEATEMARSNNFPLMITYEED